MSVDFGTQSDNISVDSSTQSTNADTQTNSTQSDSDSDDDDSGDNESILSNIILDLQSKNVDLQKAVEEERVQKELYKEMYEILESEHDKDTKSEIETETQTDLTHDSISDIEHDALWQKVKRLNDKKKWKNKLLDKDLEIQSNKLQNNIEKIKLQQDTDLEVLSEKIRYLANRDKFVNDNLDYFNNMQNEINRLQNELRNTLESRSVIKPDTEGATETQGQSVMDDNATDFNTETQGQSVMDIAVSPNALGTTSLPEDSAQERWTWPEFDIETEGKSTDNTETDQSTDNAETQGQTVMDIAVNTPLPEDNDTDFNTETQGQSVMDIAVDSTTEGQTQSAQEKWTWPEFDMETEGKSTDNTETDQSSDNAASIDNTETDQSTDNAETEGQSVPTRKRNALENTSTLKRERLDSENEAVKWEKELNKFLESAAKQKEKEKMINNKIEWERMLKKSVEESILQSKIAKANKIAFDIERNIVYTQPTQRKMQFNTINIHDKPRNNFNETKRVPTAVKKSPLKNTIAGKVMKDKRKISLPKKLDKDQLSQTKYGQAVLRNLQNRS